MLQKFVGHRKKYRYFGEELMKEMFASAGASFSICGSLYI